MSYSNEPHIIGRCVGRPLADDRPIVARHLSSADVSADDRPIVKFWDLFRKSASYVFNVIAPVGRQNDVYRPIKIQKSYWQTVFLNVIAAYLTIGPLFFLLFIVVVFVCDFFFFYN